MVMSVPLTMSNLSTANRRQGDNRTARIAAQTEPQRPGKNIFSDPPFSSRAVTVLHARVNIGASVIGSPAGDIEYHQSSKDPAGRTSIPLRYLVGRCYMDRRTAGPSAPPDFLSKTAASVDFMRLSLRRAAYVAVGRAVT